jgi:hypothetical protein
MCHLMGQAPQRLLSWAKHQELKKLVQADHSQDPQASYSIEYSPTTGYKDGRYSSAMPLSAGLPTMQTLRQKLWQHVDLDSSKNLPSGGSIPSWRSVTLRLRHSQVELESQSFGSDLDDRHYLILRFVSSRHSTLRRAFARVICFLTWLRTLARSTED